MMEGLEEKKQGRIKIDGKDMRGIKKYKRKVKMMLK